MVDSIVDAHGVCVSTRLDYYTGLYALLAETQVLRTSGYMGVYHTLQVCLMTLTAHIPSVACSFPSGTDTDT